MGSDLQTKTLELARRFLYFNEPTTQEYKDNLYKLFCDTWDNIPAEDQKIIENSLGFIITKPIIDQLNPSTVGFTHLCPPRMSWIIWDPFFLGLHMESLRFLLAHELAHVFLQHPQKGSEMSREDENKWALDTAEPEAVYQTLKVWHFMPSLDDKEMFKSSDY